MLSSFSYLTYFSSSQCSEVIVYLILAWFKFFIFLINFSPNRFYFSDLPEWICFYSDTVAVDIFEKPVKGIAQHKIRLEKKKIDWEHPLGVDVSKHFFGCLSVFPTQLKSISYKN